MLLRNIPNFINLSCRNISKVKYNNKKRIIFQDLDKKKEYDCTPKRNNLKLYMCGLAETGALGIERTLKKHKKMNCRYVNYPTRLSFGERFDILDIAAGYGFSLFLVKSLDDGISVFGSGINTNSQIGFHKLGGSLHRPMDILIYPAPILIPKKDDVQPLAMKVAAGRAHSIILTNTGSIFTLGHNDYGQCARKIIPNETYFGKQLPDEISSEYFMGEKISDVICGQDHTFFTTDSGKVFSCGWGADGQTGLGHYKNCDTPTLVEGDIKNEKIVKISSKADCVLALNDKGEVFGWGNSEYGQITDDGNQQVNLPIKLDVFKGLGKIIDVAAAGSSCAVLNENGDVFVWGFGILGFGPEVEHSLHPEQIPPTIFGRNSFNTESRVISINAGLTHFAAITNDNDMYTWGRNKFGCLGLGHDNDQFFPFKTSLSAKVEKVSCGVDHTIAICKNFIQQ